MLDKIAVIIFSLVFIAIVLAVAMVLGAAIVLSVYVFIVLLLGFTPLTAQVFLIVFIISWGTVRGFEIIGKEIKENRR